MRKLNCYFGFREVIKLNIKKLVIRYAFLSLILILIQGKNVFALGESEVRFNNLTLKDGLSQSTVNRIIQDNKGYMWFGTSDGLLLEQVKV